MRAVVAALCGAALLTGCSLHADVFFEDGGAAAPSRTATLTVGRDGAATGSVSAQDVVLTCTDICTATVNVGTAVTLLASPDRGAAFGGWTGGACGGAEPTCVVSVTHDLTVAARFDVAMFNVEISMLGGGEGIVMSTPGDIACPAICSTSVPYNTTVELIATPTSTSTFTGWTGACTGTDTCSVTVTAATMVGATFAADNELDVALTGTGTGSVASSPPGIDCGADCTERFPPGTSVTLLATAADDSTFTGWDGGGCSGADACVVTLDQAAMVTATFALQQHALSIVKAGDGSGTVSSDPAGISCGDNCLESYDAHTVVTLTAAPADDSVFAGWSGDCVEDDSGDCIVTMDRAATVTATFALQHDALTVVKNGKGKGTVTSDLPGISCGTDCSAVFTAHTVVTLTAAAADDSTFGGWSGGGCSGQETCVVTMEGAASVTATFNLRQFQLTVTRVGNGTVTSSPAGISCGTTCSALYDAHTVVTLTPVPASDTVFASWSGGCSGAGPCAVTMDNAVTVTANFALRQVALTVTKGGSGSGTVTSNPAGISCGATCMANFAVNTLVELTATPVLGSTFAGWSGACSGPTCQVSMSVSRSVTATFTLVPSSTYTASFTGGQNSEAQCASWNDFLGSLTSPSYNRVTISGSMDPTGVTCNDPALATQLCQALHNSASVSSVLCNGRAWNVGSCGSAVELSADGNTCACDIGYIARPCVGNTNWGGVNTTTCDSNPSQTITVTCQ